MRLYNFIERRDGGPWKVDPPHAALARHPALQGPPDAWLHLRMTAQHLLEDGDGP